MLGGYCFCMILPYAPLFNVPDTYLPSHPIAGTMVESLQGISKEMKCSLVRIIGIALTKIQTAFEENDDLPIRINQLHQCDQTFFLFENKEIVITVLERNGIEATCIQAFGQERLMAIELIVLETFSLFERKPGLYRTNRFFYEPTKVDMENVHTESGLPSVNAASTQVLCKMRSLLIEDGNNPSFLLMVEQALDAILYCSGNREAFHLIVESAQAFSSHPLGNNFIELINWYHKQSSRMSVFFDVQ